MVIAFLCTVCGVVCGTDEVENMGSFKHPICEECYLDPEKKAIWLKQLKREHPELYVGEVYLRR